MKYEMMFPDQLRLAIKENWPVVLPIGVLEYHGEHCCLGVDTLLVIRAVEALERKIKLIHLPAFYYGASSHAVEAPEGNGSVHIHADELHDFGKELFGKFLRIGFRNIHGFIHHQSENFAAGMPTDLAFKLASRQALFDFLEKEKGEGWWGKPEMANYYAAHAGHTSPFDWIRIHPLLDAETQARFPIDHAGKQETSLMLALCPEGVDMKKLSKEKWYTQSAVEASREYGEEAKGLILKKMEALLS